MYRMSRPPVIRTKAEVQAKLSLLEVCLLIVTILLKSPFIYTLMAIPCFPQWCVKVSYGYPQKFSFAEPS